MTQYGIYEKALISKDFEKSLIYAKSVGYNFWEIAIDNDRKERLDWNKEQINQLLTTCQDTEMPIYNMVLSLHRDYPLGSDDEEVRNQALNYLEQAIDLASNLGVRTIQIAGYYSSGANENDGSIRNYTESLREGASYASSKGILLGIENMDYDLIEANTILEIIKEIDNPFLGVFLDVGNFAANELDPIRELENCLPYLIGLHLKETDKGVYRRLKFGKGIVKFQDIFNFLEESNYKGYFGVEMWNDENPDSLNEIKHAIEWLIEQR